MVHTLEITMAEQTRNKFKPSFLEGKRKWPIQDPRELLLQQQPVREGNDMQIWLQSRCAQPAEPQLQPGSTGVSTDKGKGCSRYRNEPPRAGLLWNPTPWNNIDFPLGNVFHFILPKIYSSAQHKHQSTAVHRQNPRVSLPRCYWANWRREVLPELCLLIQISKTKFSDWWVWLEDQHMHLKMTKSIMNTSRDFVAICTSFSSMRSQRNGNSKFPLW